MSAKQEATKAEHKTKKFGKSERSIPHHTQKAKKFYPAEDEAKPKRVCEAVPIQSYSWRGQSRCKITKGTGESLIARAQIIA